MNSSCADLFLFIISSIPRRLPVPTVWNNTFFYFVTLRLLNVNVPHIYTSSSLFMRVFIAAFAALPSPEWETFFAAVPSFLGTLQTADCQFVCVCVVMNMTAHKHGLPQKKRLVHCNKSFQIVGTLIFKRISVTAEKSANLLWKLEVTRFGKKVVDCN